MSAKEKLREDIFYNDYNPKFNTIEEYVDNVLRRYYNSKEDLLEITRNLDDYLTVGFTSKNTDYIYKESTKAYRYFVDAVLCMNPPVEWYAKAISPILRTEQNDKLIDYLMENNAVTLLPTLDYASYICSGIMDKISTEKIRQIQVFLFEQDYTPEKRYFMEFVFKVLQNKRFHNKLDKEKFYKQLENIKVGNSEYLQFLTEIPDEAVDKEPIKKFLRRTGFIDSEAIKLEYSATKRVVGVNIDNNSIFQVGEKRIFNSEIELFKAIINKYIAKWNIKFKEQLPRAKLESLALSRLKQYYIIYLDNQNIPYRAAPAEEISYKIEGFLKEQKNNKKKENNN